MNRGGISAWKVGMRLTTPHHKENSLMNLQSPDLELCLMNVLYLLQSVAHVEAFIDFSEDENIEDNVMDAVEDKLINLKKVIQVCL
jgi:tRNA U34 5-carboxymethylaminomethyl modifying GTPase MnmE/TrmE